MSKPAAAATAATKNKKPIIKYNQHWTHDSLYACGALRRLREMENEIDDDPHGHLLRFPKIMFKTIVDKFRSDKALKMWSELDNEMEPQKNILQVRVLAYYKSYGPKDKIKSINVQCSFEQLVHTHPRLATRLLQRYYIEKLRDVLLWLHDKDCGCPGYVDWVEKEKPKQKQISKWKRKVGAIGTAYKKTKKCIHAIPRNGRKTTLIAGEAYIEDETYDLVQQHYRCTNCGYKMEQKLENKLGKLTAAALYTMRNARVKKVVPPEPAFLRHMPPSTNIKLFVDWKLKVKYMLSESEVRRVKRLCKNACKYFKREYKE